MTRIKIALALAALLATAVPAAAAPDNYVQLTQGRELATIGDCIACHTALGGTPYAGGLALQTPFGPIITPNLTPDPATGLGNWSSDDFARAMHEGIRPDGAHLYPAFPYNYYTKVTRADTDAIFAYLRSLPPVSHAVDRNALPFPFNIRASLIAWNTLFLKEGYFVPDPKRSAEFNRGAYLVQGLGHCGACHTPRNALGAGDADRPLQASQINNWVAPNLSNDDRQGLGKWSADDIVQYLRTGQNGTAIASGPMAEVVGYSTSRMSETDLRAIATYLKENGAAAPQTPATITPDDSRMRIGAAIYADSCMACHNRTGEGVSGLFPRLAGTPSIQQTDPTSLIHVVIAGARGSATDAKPTGPAMPSLGWRLNNDQIAAVVTYIRNSWGNAAPAATASQVAALRAKIAPPSGGRQAAQD